MRLIPIFQRFSFGLSFLVVRLLCAGEFTGSVVRVQDGDTITILYDERQVRVRLSGIDCPEKSQPFGPEARRVTEELVLGKAVTVIEEDIDRYGRIVGSVILPDGLSLNHQIVAAGLAWWYRKYAPDDASARTLESDARNRGLGLWADPVPVAPWDWRKEDHVRSRSDRQRSETRTQSRYRARSRR